MHKVIILFLFLLLLSCKDAKKEKLTHLVAEWQGREVLFPSEVIFTRYVKDTVDYTIPDTDYKILIYADESGCVACKLQLDKWKSFIAEIDSISDRTIPFLLFLDHEDHREVHFLLRHYQFDLPVCVDREGRLNDLNHFPKEKGFDAFLLDKNNKVLVIGNPIHNLAIRDLYLKQIKGEETSSGKGIRTVATVDSNEVNMGVFPKTETRIATFNIQNTGDNPLVILGSSTTCGCASVRYDKHPAQIGECLKVEVTMTPKEQGFFSETITVKSNTDKIIHLYIKGQAQ